MTQSIKATHRTEANNVIVQNSEIVTTETFEQNEQTVNDVFLRTVVQGNELDNAQHATFAFIPL